MLLLTVALHRYLEDEPYVSVVERRTILHGYELYVVEQWACSRKSPTLVVATHTGNEKHSIAAGVLAVPADESLWSAKLNVYFKAADQYHARPKDTGIGQLLVTNLSNFPSSLTVIPVPDGDVRKHRQVFMVNEDLKRMGCSGRSGMTLSEPTEATKSKFFQLYKTSERIPFLQSVTELVKLCQVALYMFDHLEPEYIDGLLCDVTEAAIGNWWTEIGAEHYNFEPSDGILGPSTVSALLGMLMGARNRLNWQGAPVSKDVFEIENTKRGISYFQRAQKLEKTRRLDRLTLFRLHTATAKAAAGEGWGVQKAVKSTVTEIGGKRGEIVIDMVSGKDKGGLADIETLDFERFVKLAHGERAKWLWHGKARRAAVDSFDLDHELSNLIGAKVDSHVQASKRAMSMPVQDDANIKRLDDAAAPGMDYYSAATGGDQGDRDPSRRTVFKSVAGKMSDAKSGLGRIKDAVGGNRRGHGRGPSLTTREDFSESVNGFQSPPDGQMAPGIASGPATVSRAFTWKNKPEEYLAAVRRGDPDALRGLQDDIREPYTAPILTETKPSDDGVGDGGDPGLDLDLKGRLISRTSSTAPSAADETDVQRTTPEPEKASGRRQLFMSRRHSLSTSTLVAATQLNEARWARRLSFGDAAEAVLGWDEINSPDGPADDPGSVNAQSEGLARLFRHVNKIVNGVEPWVNEEIQQVTDLDERFGKDSTELQELYHQLRDACQRVRIDSEGMLDEERDSLRNSIKEVDTLVARLEYEINALVAKANDVEDGIRSFERQVADVEKRADELKIQLETESWLHWFVRTLTGVGTGPNITRSVQ